MISPVYLARPPEMTELNGLVSVPDGYLIEPKLELEIGRANV